MSLTEADEVIDADVDYSVYVLAEKADVHSPDNNDSPGARFLRRVESSANEVDADALLENIRAYVAEGNDAEDFDVNDLSDDLRDSMSEWADGDVQIYTYQLWQEFTDLCLWQEDFDDLNIEPTGDLTKIASAAQFTVARRLLGTLLADRARLLLEANPVDEHAHEDAENVVLHLDAVAEDWWEGVRLHLIQGHGIDPRNIAPAADLDTLHRTLDHSDLPDDEPEPMDMSGGSGGSDNR